MNPTKRGTVIGCWYLPLQIWQFHLEKVNLKISSVGVNQNTHTAEVRHVRTLAYSTTMRSDTAPSLSPLTKPLPSTCAHCSLVRRVYVCVCMCMHVCVSLYMCVCVRTVQVECEKAKLVCVDSALAPEDPATAAANEAAAAAAPAAADK